MPVNLMQGKLDGDNDDKNKKKSNSIDLTLEKKNKLSKPKDNQPASEKIGISIEKPVKHPEVKEIKVKVPSDIKIENNQSDGGGSLKLVTGIVLLLVVSTGVLLFLLNSESQDLRGSVNVLPETNSTQIVDDILAEDFNNEVQENATETEDIEVQQSPNDSNDSTQSNSSDNASEMEEETTQDEPLVIDTSSIISQTNTNEPESQAMEVDPVVTEEQINEGEIIQDYNIQNSAEVTNELLTEQPTNANNDFSPEIAQSDVTVMEEVSESEEIQGETGPGLWISVIVASILSLAYARRDERQLD